MDVNFISGRVEIDPGDTWPRFKCHLYPDNYGSDHKATYSKWNLQPELREDVQPQLMYERTDWSRVDQKIRENVEPSPRIGSREELDYIVKNFITIYQAMVQPGLEATTNPGQQIPSMLAIELRH